MTNDLISGLPPVHPGDVLREDVLPALAVSKSDFADALHVSRQALYNLLSGKSSLSTAIALRLEKLIGGSAEMWLNLQRDYDLAVERPKLAAELSDLKALEAA